MYRFWDGALTENAYERGWEMGELIRLKCEKCGRTFDLGIGQGMLDYDPEKVLMHFDPAASDTFRAVISASQDKWSYRKMIGYCSKCRTYSAIPTIHITNKGKEQALAAKCACGNTCVIFDDTDRVQMSRIKCPDCLGTMTAQSTGMWD